MNFPDVTFNERTIEGLIKRKFNNEKTKLSQDALKLMCEVVKIHALELMHRGAEQAVKEGAQEVSMEHLEKVLPQFLLDFS